MLGFSGQETKSKVLDKYLHNERENTFSWLFTDKILNIIIIEYNIL